ncbi:MAG: hypothetical protein KatS3mg025_0914 [Bacteroidia bacterium]|nr:MAG: hypothetical protein KatS3mg025_0914 [Bacteroidia bacterium]
MKAVRVFLGLLLVVGATYGQNVGIGTSAPVGKLHVVGSAGVGRSVIIDNREIKFRGDGVAHISIFGPTTGRDRLSISRSSSSAIPGTEDAELVSITAAGNVGIGQPTPAGHLTIRNGWQNWIQLEDAINGHQYYFHNPGGGDRLEVGVYDAGAGTTRWGVWVVTPAGNIGIGTTAPTQRLDVNGNVQFSGALMPGGIPGTAGQVLVSQGATTPPIWRYEVPPGGIIMYSGPWNFDATGLGTGPLTGWGLVQW